MTREQIDLAIAQESARLSAHHATLASELVRQGDCEAAFNHFTTALVHSARATGGERDYEAAGKPRADGRDGIAAIAFEESLVAAMPLRGVAQEFARTFLRPRSSR